MQKTQEGKLLKTQKCGKVTDIKYVNVFLGYLNYSNKVQAFKFSELFLATITNKINGNRKRGKNLVLKPQSSFCHILNREKERGCRDGFSLR